MAQGMTFGAGGDGQTKVTHQPEPAGFGDVPAQGRDALPLDLPDEVQAVVPVFRSRRKAELLPPLRPAGPSNPLDPTWRRALERTPDPEPQGARMMAAVLVWVALVTTLVAIGWVIS